MTPDDFLRLLQGRYEEWVQLAMRRGLSRVEAEVRLDPILDALAADPRVELNRAEQEVIRYIEGRIKLKVGDFRRTRASRTTTGVGSGDEEDLLMSHADTRESPAWAAASLAEGRQAVYQAVCELPDQQQIVIILRYWLELRPGSIGAICGEPESTINNWLYRARKALEARLGRDPFDASDD